MCINALDENQSYSKILILQAMMTLVSSWNDVPSHVIINCFSKAGISKSSQKVALTDEYDPFKEFIEELDELREVHPNAVPENVSAEIFCSR